MSDKPKPKKLSFAEGRRRSIEIVNDLLDREKEAVETHESQRDTSLIHFLATNPSYEVVRYIAKQWRVDVPDHASRFEVVCLLAKDAIENPDTLT